MYRSLALAPLLLLSTAAFGETLTGTIDDPSLRRKVDLVYVERVDTKFRTPAPPTMDQKGNTYLPHVLPVVAGSKVIFRSLDPELHNVYARGDKKMIFNNAVLPNMKFEERFAEPGVVHLTCNIHKEMSAYVIVLQNPFWAAPDRKSGAFAIDGLPPGTYTVRIWGERLTDEEKAKKFTFQVGSAKSLKIAQR